MVRAIDETSRLQRFRRSLVLAAALAACGVANAAYVSAGRIYTDAGARITLRGVNWFSFETETNVVHGLWARSMTGMLDQMQQLGFNAVRVPFCPKLLQGARPTSMTGRRRAATSWRCCARSGKAPSRRRRLLLRHHLRLLPRHRHRRAP